MCKGHKKMKKLNIYLDTSAIGYLDNHEKPDEMADMQMFWEMAKQGKYEIVISEVTMAEINNNSNKEKVDTLTNYLTQVEYDTMLIDDAVKEISELIKSAGILKSEKTEDDRLHLACALISKSDVLLSYNFKHLVNYKTINGIRGISTIKGYGNINIMTAAMIIDVDRDEGEENDN